MIRIDTSIDLRDTELMPILLNDRVLIISPYAELKLVLDDKAIENLKNILNTLPNR